MMSRLHILRTVLIAALSTFTMSAYSQEATTAAVNVSGGSYSDDKIVLEWSVGELVRIDTRYSDNKALVLTQGLLQPDLTRQLILPGDPKFAQGEITLLPNPVRSILQVQFSGRQAGYLRCMIYDTKGVRLIQSGFQYYGFGYTHTINMSKLAAGNYFLYAELEPVAGSQIRKGSYTIIKLN